MFVKRIAFYIFFIHFTNSIILENENIIRNHIAYQSTTTDDTEIATKATDNLKGEKDWSRTKSSSAWWTVELGGYFNITEICFHNRFINSSFLFFLN